MNGMLGITLFNAMNNNDKQDIQIIEIIIMAIFFNCFFFILTNLTKKSHFFRNRILLNLNTD